ncbi:MAG: acetate/propionate family kinase [Hydrocarboniphaga sp.]|uniref:acetate/propionate family kinase n=1 Tax=Hydrocarboniphaga sp. TaxID=2033016 RepID=UPI00262ED74C|nr:acetate/propionate family kinase [Hydrocarboniphaga sp.]MDB5971217.1 acetate/propionate family kinase [Hydrocarboniphaga sp.]
MTPVVPETAMRILALNSGSSSLKFGCYRVSRSQTEQVFEHEVENSGQAAAFAQIDTLLKQAGIPRPDAIGHRIVHGGASLQQPCMIDPASLQTLKAATPFAPLHMPAALSVVRYASEHFREIPQVACFDTGFHSGLPDAARVLPLPKNLLAEGIRRYGFHGLSCESIVHQLAGRLPERLIVAHLGNGASVTAIKAGLSVDTSMAMTPNSGVLMGTRCGDIDPGVLIYLMREKGYDLARLEELLDHRSGLLGISGIASDLRRLHEAAPGNADARLALDMFARSVCKQIAGMITTLQGIDTLVFTGGIGEHDPAMRAAIVAGLSCLGVNLDEQCNRDGYRQIHHSSSRCEILKLTSQEDHQIARHTWAVTGTQN